MNLQLKPKEKYDLLFISLVFLLSFSSVSAKDETVIKLEALEKRLIILEQENAKLTERIQRLEKKEAVLPDSHNEESFLCYDDRNHISFRRNQSFRRYPNQ